MKSTFLKFWIAIACSLLPAFHGRGEEVPPSATADIAVRAKNFLATLDDAERGKLVYDFNDNAQRKRWSNLPTTIVKRGGLRMGDPTKPQQDAAMAILAAALSSRGYEKVLQIVEGDELLKKN